jgi:hypothetical protein
MPKAAANFASVDGEAQVLPVSRLLKNVTEIFILSAKSNCDQPELSAR